MEDQTVPQPGFEPIEPVRPTTPPPLPGQYGAAPPPPGGPPLPPPPPGPGWWLASDGNWYPPSAPPAPAKTNGFAIASLVLGIMWIYWIGSILALIFGYVAKRRIDESHGRETGRGMAIAGIVLGWLGVAALVLTIGAVVLIALGADSESQFERIGDSIEPDLGFLVDSCRAGDMGDCDSLYFASDYGSWEEDIAESCGGRSEFDIGGECATRFG